MRVSLAASSSQITRRASVLIGALLGAMAVLFFVAPHLLAQEADPCQAPANEIVAENCKPGDPASEWDISGDGDQSIQGFATDMSVNQGDTARFKVKTDATDYRLDIYRMGYYGGDGARKVATVQPSASLPQNQPSCLNQQSTGLIDCGNWGVSAEWQVPADAVSGIYFARLVRESGQSGASHIVFVVRDDDGNSDLLFQTSDTTWQAYNQYGGNSLYVGQPAGRAYKVSYNRPFTTRRTSDEDWLFNSEYPMVRWLERNGYDVSYFTGVDSDRLGTEIQDHEAFLSVGHDEYWSAGQRQNVRAARDAGVDLGFFSGNESFWKTRWEDSHRTLVSYKETHAGAKIDPTSEWTGTWRDNRSFNPEGPQPENALTGTIFTVNCCSYPMKVPAADGKMRLWRNTDIANLNTGQTATLPDATVGYEWDEDLDNGSRPDGLIRMSSTTVDVPQYIQDQGSNYGPGTATHALTLYRDANGTDPDALVFGAGTVQWPWGLDANHDRGGGAPDTRMQQATVNLFADMGVQPAKLETGSVATGSADNTAPTSQITSPSGGDTVEEDEPVTITGTASDGETGGVVGGVEVSVDGGQTWHRAEGREDWRYTWTPEDQGQATIKSRAADDSVNLESPSAGRTVTVGPQAPATCPCTIWDEGATPANPNGNDGQPIETGTKFRADTGGYITGLRFYKGSNNTGTHVGHLWSSTGQQLAEATFTGETTSGWQEVRFASPVQINEGTTYVASYHSSSGGYTFTDGYFASGVDNPPLRALADGVDGDNGVYKYGASGFPTGSFQKSNYWVDVVFETSVGPDTTPPSVQSVSPGNGQNGVNTNAAVSATFDEAMDSGTISSNSFELRDDANDVVQATVGYAPGTRTAILTPSAPLSNSSTYTAKVKSGSGGVKDAAGNALEQDKTWSFTTAAPPPPPPDEGPGGPILVITDSSNPFGRYYAEILRNEGLNEFTAKDISSVSAATLADYDVAILGEMPLSASQAGMLSGWVDGGGNLVAMRPDGDLADLLGLSSDSGTIDNAYLKVDTAAAPGKGIVGESMQFHGTADRYSLNGATALATLYSGANTATQNPAVTVRDVGSSGGQAAAFTYDLAKSVIYTRQGNPAWAGQERDGEPGLRPDDMFYPDWVDFSKVAIPQADEQQRLLANLIGEMNLDRGPLPRFWYFPRGEEAVVVMTGDDHGNGGTAGQFDWFESQSPQGCSVADWECIRGTSYIYPNTPLSNAQAEAYENDGFEVALHINTDCTNPWTPQNLPNYYSDQLAAWRAKYTSLNVPTTNRTHCLAWSDWATQPKVELDNGIRLDTNYYYWPAAWIQDRPGLFTGSGLPMRFADEDGKMIDVYQANTQMTDESGQNLPLHIKALIDKALGPEGYYGAFTANMHTDSSSHPGAQAIVNEAKSRGVPVVSAGQMLEWLDGRNGSSFGNTTWNANKLTFSVNVGTGARGLQAMVPVESDSGKLTRLQRDANPVDYTEKTIKGVEYATFSATAGAYEATYEADATAPAISGLTATPDANGAATITWTTDEPATTRVDYGTSAGTLDQSATEPGLATSHSIRLTGLAANTTYHYRVTSADADDNAATAPQSVDPPASFETPDAGLTDTTTDDFSAGTPGTATYVAQDADGEIALKPTVGEEFSGPGLPSGWTGTPWGAGGAAAVSGGNLTVDGARAGTDALYAPGRSLEFVATFGADTNQHVGFGTDYNGAPWAMFSTGSNQQVGLYARTNSGSAQANTLIAGISPTEKHRYRIEWKASEVVYYVDGAEVARHAIGIPAQMRPLASDLNVGGPAITLDWVRMSPYQTPGTLESRIFDSSKNATDWRNLASTIQKPAGTNATFETRSGDTATPDGTWSAWEPVASDGTISSPDARYVQYRANLSTNDQSISPAVEQVTLTYGEGAPDTTAPIISALNAAPATDGTATITWSTNESSTSLGEYGTSPGALTQSASAPTPTSTHSVKLTGLEAGTTYYYRVSSADGTGNAATSPAEGQNPASFETPDAGFTDTTTDDFSAGTPGAASYVANGIDGEVALKPTVGEEFSGTSLPAGWSSSPWTGGTSTVTGGNLLVDGARANADALYGPGRSLEFVATFGAAQFQHVGFGQTVSDTSESWAMFSTFNRTDALFARTDSNGTMVDTQIPNSGNLIGSKHLYSIEWASSEVRFFVDGTLVHTQPVTIGAQMRPLVSDFNSGGPNLRVDWMRMGPYQTPGTFESRIFDSSKNATDWRNLISAVQKPAGTNVAFETRSGNTATPDGTWSGWQAVGDAIASPDNRYIQYRINLSTSDQSVSPSVEQVTLGYRLDKTPPQAPSKPDLDESSDSGAANDDDITNDATPTFTGTAEADASVELFADDDSLGTTDAGSDGAWSFTPNEQLADGTYSVTAKATDAAGNASPASEALSVKIDTAAPDTTITSGPQGTTGNTTAEFAFSSGEQNASFGCKLDDGSYETCESPRTYTGLGDGQHTFSVRAVDLAGNADASPAERGFTVDATRPEAPAITSPQNNTYDNDGTIEVTGTAETGSTVELSEGNTSVGTDEADPITGAWSIQLSSVPEGEHTYTATARDGAGNTSDVSVAVRVTVDKTGSDTTITGGPEGFVNATSATFEFSSSETGSTFECSLDGAAYANCSSPRTLTGLADGAHTFEVRATDAAGNTDGTPASRGWTVDTDVPQVPQITSPANNSYDTDGNLSFSGTAEPDSTVRLFEGTDTRETTTAGAGGGWSISLASVSNGTHSYTVQATDRAGNASAASTGVTITVDTVAPEVTSFSPTANAINVAPSSNVEATFSEPMDGSTLTGTTFTLTADGAASPVSATVTYGALARKATLDPAVDLAPNTRYTAVVKGGVKDAAGNQLGTNESWSFTTAQQATPTLDTTITSGPSGLVASKSATFAFQSNRQGSTFQCSRDGAQFSACSSPKTYSNLSQGAHDFRVRARDASGNLDATPAQRSWTVDTVGPKVSEMNPAPNSTTTNRRPTIGATVTDAQTNLAKADVELFVDNVRITNFDYNPDTDRLTYTPPSNLSLAKHIVRVTASDLANNVGTRQWNFKITR